MTDPSATETLPADDVTSLGETLPGTDGASPLLSRGDEVGRYVVVDRVGQGGMGVVYAAFDPELDRKIALKLVRVRQTASTKATAGRSRLLREAQAMAKLQHPNVIAVHDVGTHGEEVFVAMEFVDGRPLGSWVRETQRTWQEIVEVFIQAGRGLEAAHQRDIVHRDFKPDNVLVDREGRVRVLDFGLARRGDDAEVSPSGEAEEGSPGLDSLTRTGARLGTPAYMAPEQHLGESVDPRTDQFAFCVALYEALYGERPFEGDNLAALSVNVIEGNVREAPRDAPVPGWLRRILMRGLAREPQGRYPAMGELLEALGHDPAARRRHGWLAAAAAVPLVAGLYAATAGTEPEVCTGARAHLVGVWDPEVRGAAEKAFTASRKSHASASWSIASQELDVYADDWVDAHTRACRATRVLGEQSEEMLDLRMACLALRRDELRAVSGVLQDAADDAVTRVARVVGTLTPVEECADISRLGKGDLPDEATQRDAVLAERARLAEALALAGAGRYAPARERVKEVIARAETLEWAPLLARATFRLGRLQDDSADPADAYVTLRKALVLALAADQGRLAGEVLNQLVWFEGGRRADYEEATWMADLARAQIEALGGDPELESVLEQNLGIVAHTRGDYDASLAAFERALDLRVRVKGENDSGVADLKFNIAAVNIETGAHELAEKQLLEALEISRTVAGPEHPEVAYCRNNLSIVRERMGKYEEARQDAEDAIRIWTAALGEEHPEVAAAHNSLGSALASLGDLDGALRSYERSHAIKRATLGPDHPDVFGTLGNMGDVYLARGELDRAEETFRAAFQGMHAALGDSHPDVGEFKIGLGEVSLARKDSEAAFVAFEEALALVTKHQDDRHPTAVRARLLMALASLRLGRTDRARELFERVERDTAGKLYPGYEEVVAELRAGLG